MGFDYSISSRNGVGIVRPVGRLMEKYEAAALLEEVSEFIAQGVNRFVIDLKNLEYINSSGLNVLINILTRSRNAGGETVICNLSGKLKKLFVMTRLDTVFHLTAGQTSAMVHLENIAAEKHGS
jgi:anti-sigma B factor antagonist